MLKAMLLAVAVAATVATHAAPTYVIDTQDAASVFSEAHQLCTADAGRLWGTSLCGPMMFVDPATHQAIANAPVEGATLDGGLYRFTVGQDVGTANTSLEFQHQRWTMILWPLPQDPQARAVELMHESYHRVQPLLHLVGTGGLGTNGHLATQVGRIWLRGEINALRVALRASGAARTGALRDAVAMALYRWSLFPGAQEQERGLNLNEGLAESTGIDVGLPSDQRVAYAITDLERLEKAPSFVRAFPYGLGPAYVELMDMRDPGWRVLVNDNSNLVLLATRLYGVTVTVPTKAQAQVILDSYGGARIVAQEEQRAKRDAIAQARYEKEFVGGPVLVLSMSSNFSITFNPQEVEQFAGHGSVYHVLQLSDAWGTLRVSGGDALISNDFKTVTVEHTGAGAIGKGWTLQLNPHFALVGMKGVAGSVTAQPAAP